ncbi:hypothetical protein [Trinickia dinghuensis]|uniref:Uncharacterized protein n=1 Tax=Trinickia dinghuensis TaxID=2291023 RepID=A0A3D8JNY0_9BURK|nr:hypothetical protein [Trinickia dinghuensis]RDU94718.1 hypothetical protein DWV00_32460 [Trinickia dinghuensis]
MRKIAYIALTLVLTSVILAGIIWLAFLTPWFANGGGWDLVEPLFRLFGAVGEEQTNAVLTGTLLAASLLLALLVAWLIARIEGRFRRWRAMQRQETPHRK